MDFSKKATSVIFLDRARFDFYSEKQNKVYSFDLSAFTSNLELVNPEGLEQQIKDFAAASDLISENAILVLSDNILFVKALPPNSEEEDEELQKFIDSVPFEHVGSKSYPIEGGKLVVAANRAFYTEIKKAFDASGVFINIVVPVYSAGVNPPNARLDENAAKLILKNAEILEQNAIEVFEKEQIQKINTQKGKDTKNNKRVYMLAGVFGLLIIILITVLLNSSKAETPPKNSSKTTTGPQTTPVPIIQTANSPEIILSPENIRIIIATNQDSLSNGLRLKNDLTGAGFKNVAEQVLSSASSSSVIIFTPSVQPILREQIAGIVSRVSTDFLTRESQLPETDVQILLIK